MPGRGRDFPAAIERDARLCHKLGHEFWRWEYRTLNRNQLLIGLIVLAVVALGVVGYIVWQNMSSSDDSLASGPGAQYNVQISSWDRPMGSPKAPVTIVEYGAPTCPHCAFFDVNIFPQVKQNLIDKGKVYYIFRVFPLSQYDVAAESIARCLPEDNYFQFIDLLFRNQSKWDPDGYEIPDVHAALVQMGKVAGMSAEQVDSCINNQAEAKRIEDVGTEAQTKYGINGTPTFLVNGQSHGPFGDFAEMQAFIDPMLAKK